MLVVDMNDTRSSSHNGDLPKSPVLHTAIHNILSGLQERDDVEITVLYGRQEIAQGGARVEGSIHYLPVLYKPLPLRGMGGAMLGRTYSLLRKLRELKPDLVHGQGTERESGLVAACCFFPSLITLHGNLSEIAKIMKAKPFSYFWLAAKLERWSLPRVDMVHCLSSHTQQSVASIAEHTRIIPNAVAAPYFLVDRKVTNHPSVVCMAGISEWKNPQLLIEASDKLHLKYPDTKIHFYGACSPDHPYGRTFLESIQERAWCVYHGQSSQNTLLDALATATCSVLPSLMENCPLSILESMAAGVPVLGANVGGIPDIIKHNITGLLFDPNCANELADQLIRLHADPSLMQQLATAGKNSAIQRFSIESVSKEHIDMYRQTIEL